MVFIVFSYGSSNRRCATSVLLADRWSSSRRRSWNQSSPRAPSHFAGVLRNVTEPQFLGTATASFSLIFVLRIFRYRRLGEHRRWSGLSVFKNSTMQSHSFSSWQYSSTSSLCFVPKIARSLLPEFRFKTRNTRTIHIASVPLYSLHSDDPEYLTQGSGSNKGPLTGQCALILS